MTLSKDGIAGVLLLGLAIGYFGLSRDIPSSSLSDEVGADGLPRVLTAALAIVAVLILAKSLIAARKPEMLALPAGSTVDHAPLSRALGFVLIGVGYMVFAPLVGFALGIAALIMTVALFEREALSAKLAMVAAVAGIGFWLIFVRFLGAEQPMSSLLAQLMKS